VCPVRVLRRNTILTRMKWALLPWVLRRAPNVRIHAIPPSRSRSSGLCAGEDLLGVRSLKANARNNSHRRHDREMWRRQGTNGARDQDRSRRRMDCEDGNQRARARRNLNRFCPLWSLRRRRLLSLTQALHFLEDNGAAGPALASAPTARRDPPPPLLFGKSPTSKGGTRAFLENFGKG
jgi:hypothetical protein